MAATQREVRKLRPPQLAGAKVGSHIHAYVSMRMDAPVLNVTMDGRFPPKGSCRQFIKGDKIVVNNYGLGGCGWSLAAGAGSHVAKLLSERVVEVGYSNDEPVCIVGAGVAGLFTAEALLHRGFGNLTVRAAAFDNLASHKAGATGLWAPLGFQLPSVEDKKLMHQICQDSRDFYNGALTDDSNTLRGAVKQMPLYTDCVLPGTEELHASPKAVTLEFDNSTQRNMFAYDDAVYFETSKAMRQLRRHLEDNNVEFEIAELGSLRDLPERVVVNCAGAEAAKNPDDGNSKLFFAHLTHLNGDRSPKYDQDYMLFTRAKEGMLSYFPKHLLRYCENDKIGAIGGSFAEANDESDVHVAEFDRVLRDAKWFFYDVHE